MDTTMTEDEDIKTICDKILYHVGELAGLVIKADTTNRKLEAQIEKMKCFKEEIINAIKSDNSDIEWVKAHNGVAKYIYVQTVIDIINDKWEIIK